MTAAREKHDQSMSLCDLGDTARKSGDKTGALGHYNEAFKLEIEAACAAIGAGKSILFESAIEILKLIRDLEVKP